MRPDYLSALSNAKKTVSKMAQATQRLSSGYRINSAADDAAGLAISEKLRSIDRGLRQGMRNISDGMNYLDTVDGCTQEIHNMLQRMKEIAVQAANETNSRLDREALDLEYQQLNDEIFQLTGSANFNALPLVEQHMPTYGKIEGGLIHNKPIKIDSSNMPLTFTYTINGEQKTGSVTIPYGTYTVDETADLIDDKLYEMNRDIIIGVNEANQFTLQVENGHLDSISGPGASLFYETKIGSSEGYIIGVVTFGNEGDDPTQFDMRVTEGKNDEICFRIGNTDDTIQKLKLTPGVYLQQQLIDEINKQIDAEGLTGALEAIPYVNDEGKNVIALRSDKTITGLCGNFIMIDGEHPYHSPLYDIRKDNDIINTTSNFFGTAKIKDQILIEKGRNESFTMELGFYEGEEPKTVTVDIKLLGDGEVSRKMSKSEFLDTLKQQIESQAPVDVYLVDGSTDIVPGYPRSVGSIRIDSRQYGKACYIDLKEETLPSVHARYDFFDDGVRRLPTPNSPSSYIPASVTGGRVLENNITLPTGCWLVYTVNLTNGGTKTLSFEMGENYTPDSLVSELQGKLPADLADKLTFSLSGGRLKLAANDIPQDCSDIAMITANSCTARRYIIEGQHAYSSADAVPGHEVTYITTSTNKPDGSPNVTSTPGYSTDGVQYVQGRTSSTPRKELDLYVSNPVKAVTTDGTGVIESEIGSGSRATATLPGVLAQYDNPTAVKDGTTLKFTFTEDNHPIDCTVNIPAGTTKDNVPSVIQKALEQRGVFVKVTKGDNNSIHMESDRGKISFSDFDGTLMRTVSKNPAAYTSGNIVRDDKIIVPPTLTLESITSQIPLEVTSANNTIVLAFGDGKMRTYTLPEKKYESLDDLADALDDLADGSLLASAERTPLGTLKLIGGADANNITVSGGTCPIDKGQLTNPPSGYLNPDTGRYEFPAEMRVGVGSSLPLTVTTGKNDTITMTLNTPDGGTENISLQIPAGTYTSVGQLEDKIRNALAAKGLSGKVIVDAPDNSTLVFTTGARGDGVKLDNFGGTTGLELVKKKAPTDGGKVDETTNTVKYPATLTNGNFGSWFSLNAVVEITNKNNHIELVVNGTTRKADIPVGFYSRAQLVDKFRSLTSDWGIEIISSDGTFAVQTKDAGNGKTVERSPLNTSPYFDGALNYDASVQRKRDNRCYIIGKSNAPFDLTNFHEMSFEYTRNGATTTVGIDVPAKIYGSTDELAAEIQQDVDAKFSGVFEVSAQSGKIYIKEKVPSRNSSIGKFSEGGMYDRVIGGSDYTQISTHKEKAGTSSGGNISYIVGRNDLLPITPDEKEIGELLIYPGMNDKFMFDFKFGKETHKVEVQIPQGSYIGSEVANALQDAVRNKLGEMHITDENGIECDPEHFNVTIGVGGLGIVADDESTKHLLEKSANNIVLSYITPDDGSIKQQDVVIEGIRGNSAYRVFYEASKLPMPSSIVGKADLDKGIEVIRPLNDVLTFDLDGEEVTAEIPSGFYTTDTLCEELNRQYEEQGIDVRTVNYGGKIMFFTQENGPFILDNVRGTGAEDLFYDGESRQDDESPIGIHTGRRTGSYIFYTVARADNHLMHINTTGVTTVKRSLKAIDRLDDAINTMSLVRAAKGAEYNRSERAHERNEIIVENQEQAESAIRDADMPATQADRAKYVTLMEIQQRMLTEERYRMGSILQLITGSNPQSK